MAKNKASQETDAPCTGKVQVEAITEDEREDDDFGGWMEDGRNETYPQNPTN